MLIEKKKTAELLPAEYNPRKDLKPGDEEYEKLKRSIEEFGYVEPVIWNKTTGRVVGGHQRLKVLIDLGITEVDCVVVEMDEAKEKAQEVVDGYDARRAAILHEAFTGELTAEWRKSKNTSLESWLTQTLKDSCSIGSGGTPSRKKPEYFDGLIPWIKTGEIDWNEIYDSEEHISQSAIDNSSAKLYPIGAVLVAMYGMGATRGRAAILNVDATTNQAVCVLQPKDYLVNRFLFYYFMCNYWDVREKAVGGNQLNLSATIIAKFVIRIPTIDEQKEIIRILDSLLLKEQQAKETAEQVIDQIDTMKKSILARAFRGELGTNDPADENAEELLKRIL